MSGKREDNSGTNANLLQQNLNVQVSDTTGDAWSCEAGLIN
jgi:hypothetical protein